ncbi:hypothetical protein Isop_1202 [Isosphaera pallida ATCC 43644]|uniref:Uncharacterized protein n=1 Tax=Isosphaera pallida (strain ATCC 43644 / DSM 9630 / IS1B) TaxID=575540 RepID=E8R5N9_ISOPI|nr:hypothetical protein Isop_1202 [Isosphaera pallida ATCC 43644]
MFPRLSVAIGRSRKDTGNRSGFRNHPPFPVTQPTASPLIILLAVDVVIMESTAPPAVGIHCPVAFNYSVFRTCHKIWIGAHVALKTARAACATLCRVTPRFLEVRMRTVSTELISTGVSKSSQLVPVWNPPRRGLHYWVTVWNPPSHLHHLLVSSELVAEDTRLRLDLPALGCINRAWSNVSIYNLGTLNWRCSPRIRTRRRNVALRLKREEVR